MLRYAAHFVGWLGADLVLCSAELCRGCRVNCPFFFKMGACRHGDRCSRLHHRPVFSQTILLPHMYQNPRVVLTMGPHGQMPQQLDMRKIQEDVRMRWLVWCGTLYQVLSGICLSLAALSQLVPDRTLLHSSRISMRRCLRSLPSSVRSKP